MTDRQAKIVANVEKYRDMILEAERFIWTHPQVGYTEWEAHNYLKAKFEELGYKLTEAGNIPGFYTDLDTGRPGPTLCIMGELDALDIANHPDSVNGMNHSCGHNCQAAGMLGVAAGLSAPDALDGMCGKIRLMLVPAEELIQIDFRERLRNEGKIHYFGGKPEFMYRGYFDDVDLCIMVHTGAEKPEKAFGCGRGNNGCIAKTFTFKGKSSHAGGSPNKGINAEYAAMLALNACNALRETFPDADTIRFHPIVHGVNSAVNIIPDEMVCESYVRGKSLTAIKRENEKMNRAITGAALSMGAKVTLCDRPGYTPELHDLQFMQLVEQCCKDLVGEEQVEFNYERFGTGSSDFGDLTAVMPGVQFRAYGASGRAHGIDYFITDPVKACVNPAKAQIFVADALLSNGAEKAKAIIDAYEPQFKSIQEYIECMDSLILDKDAVQYDENGNVTIDYKN